MRVSSSSKLSNSIPIHEETIIENNQQQEESDSNEEEEEEEDEDEDDDPIIKRLPVYYSNSYLSSLTLLQYLDRPPRPETTHPLLPPGLRPPPISSTSNGHRTDPNIEIKAKFKPNSRHLTMEIPIERHEERWNKELAEQLGAGVRPNELQEQEEDSKNKKKNAKSSGASMMQQEEQDASEYKGVPVERIELSSLVVPNVTNYVVGVVKNDALHLSPVIQTYQLRPSLTYLDDLTTLERRAKRIEAQEAVSDDSDAEMSETEMKKLENKAVQVSIKQSADLSGGGAFGGGGAGKSGGSGGGNGRAGAALFEPLRRMEGEAWVKLTQYPVESDESTSAFEGMFVKRANMQVKLVSMTKPMEYLKV